jgi:predicted cobalt transporter CbtA
MTGTFLVRGMLVGIVAGILAFSFGKLFGEPQIDRAIAFEEQMDKSKNAQGSQDPADQAKASAENMKGMDMSKGVAMTKTEAAEPELVSRAVQSSVGLLTGVVVYSTAFGGLFSLVFAFAYGRVGNLGPRATAALLAVAGFVSIVLVPALKYPANPPAIGEPATIGYRTVLYFAMLVISVAALSMAVMLARRLVASYGAWNAVLMGAAAFIIVIDICQFVMPDINEVPEGFSATVLWRFRMASFGTQIVMWTTIGLLFGALTERSEIRRGHLPAGIAWRAPFTAEKPSY